VKPPRLRVEADGSGDYPTIMAAVAAAPPGGATIGLGAGDFREKLFIDRAGIKLEGMGRELTRIVRGDAAEHPAPEGGKLGTFRSCTAWLGGEDFSAADLAIVNEAGRGPGIGQAVAACVEALEASFERCAFLGRQDSLFLGPLPPEPRIPGGFTGPSEHLPRVRKRHRFLDCLVAGDVDFIFGSAEALFLRCEIRSLPLPGGARGWITAASTPEGAGRGFSFVDCELTGEAAPGSVFLGRPWRPWAQAAFLRCRMGAHIAPEGWDDWRDPAERATTRFVEGGSRGPGADPALRAPWARILEGRELAEALAALGPGLSAGGEDSAGGAVAEASS
jgi:pectinesterase